MSKLEYECLEGSKLTMSRHCCVASGDSKNQYHSPLTGFFEELVGHGAVVVDLAGLDGDWHGRSTAGRVVSAEKHVSELTLTWGPKNHKYCQRQSAVNLGHNGIKRIKGQNGLKLNKSGLELKIY